MNGCPDHGVAQTRGQRRAHCKGEAVGEGVLQAFQQKTAFCIVGKVGCARISMETRASVAVLRTREGLC
jgi:hypothetical protein